MFGRFLRRCSSRTAIGCKSGFYDSIPYAAGSEWAEAMRCYRRAISIHLELNVEVDGTLESRFSLLRKVALRLSTRDLCEEF